MSSLSQYDLRVINKLIQTLKQNHGIPLEYRDPKLGQKICAIIKDNDDPELAMLWNSLSVQFRAASVPATKQAQKTANKKPSLYRGKLVKAKDPKTITTAVKNIASAEEKIEGVNGHYVTYRGKKSWVSKHD